MAGTGLRTGAAGAGGVSGGYGRPTFHSPGTPYRTAAPRGYDQSFHTPGAAAYAPGGGRAFTGGGGAPHAFSTGARYAYHGRSFAAVRAPAYSYARGYGYRAFGVGARFPGFLLLRPYFISDYYLYNLSPPPGPGFTWVRFGPDALLVNTYTGEVADTAPGVFEDAADAPAADAVADAAPPDGGDGSAPSSPEPGYPGPAGYPADGSNPGAC